jgi:hypothetical protein
MLCIVTLPARLTPMLGSGNFIGFPPLQINRFHLIRFELLHAAHNDSVAACMKVY